MILKNYKKYNIVHDTCQNKKDSVAKQNDKQLKKILWKHWFNLPFNQ